MKRCLAAAAMFVTLLLAPWCAAAAAGPASAPASVVKAPRPTDAVGQAGCTRAECHAAIKERKVLHGPTSVNACDACHAQTSVEAHTFELTRQKAELCTYCHPFDAASMPVVHKPVTNGDCLACHDPHGGTTHGLLRQAGSVAELCARCHPDTISSRMFRHTPAKDGACDACHAPHGSRYANLLDVVGTDLCLTCHTGFDATLAAATFRHKALDEGCGKCHDPHGSKNPMATTQPVVEQCGGCHPKVTDAARHAKYPHSVATADRACVTCHTPHGGNVAKLASDLPSRTCMSCHREAQKTARGATIAAVPEIGGDGLHKHGPIKDGQCSGCHAPHGGDLPALLPKPYATGVYQRFAVEKFDLCFTCHDPRLATDPSAGTFTSFRDGSRNLHYVHLHEKKNGKSCRMCHETHASAGASLVRETVKFGVWQLPIRFRKTDRGGTCTTGCHVPYEYERGSRLLATSRPALVTQPAMPVARVDGPPQTMRWRGRDLAGKEVAVPDENAGAVVCFVRAPADAGVVAGLANAVASAKARVPVTVVVSGQGAGAAAAALSKCAPAVVVVDQDGSLAERCDVRAWPAVVVVRADGLVQARVSATAETLALRLGAYLNGEGAGAAATRPAVVTDGVATAVSRDLQLARSYVRDGKPEKAERLLAEALERSPDSAAVRAELVRTLILRKKGEAALAAVDRAGGAPLSAAERESLRAMALVSLERWAEARSAAEAAVAATSADPARAAEAHLLLGSIHEHQGDWQAAAREYRAASEARSR